MPLDEERLRRSLDDAIGGGDLGTGVQVTVVDGDGPITDLACGHDSAGRPMRTDVLHPGYCVTKPALALAVGQLVAEGRVDLATDLAADLGGVDRLRVEEVLAHRRAETASPNLTEWRMANAAQRAEMWAVGGQRPRVPGDPAYSEVVGWLLLERLVAATVDRPATDHVVATVLAPLGITDEVVFDLERLRRARRDDRLVVPVSGLPTDHAPLLFEIIDPGLSSCGPATGGFVSARGLGRLYHGAFVDAALAPALAAVLVADRPPVLDRTLGQVAGFRGGFMTDLDAFGIHRRLADGALGHVSAMTNAFALHARDARVTVAAVANGAVSDSDDMRLARRQVSSAVVDAMEGW